MSDSKEEVSFYYRDKSGRIRAVTIDEKSVGVIKRWVSSDFYKINDKQRRGIELSEEEQNDVDDLSRALKKLPRYKSKDDEPIYRVIDIRNPQQLKAFFERHKVGNVITAEQFMAFSKSKGYNDDANIEIRIFGCKRPRDLKKFNSGENEVLYELGQKFIVVDYKYNGRYVFEFKEITDE